MSVAPRKTTALAATLLLACCVTACGSLRLFGGGGGEAPAARVKRIAILPAAYSSHADSLVCELCPADIKLGVIDRREAELTTAFVYEAFDRHPAYEVLGHDTLSAVWTGGMRATAKELVARDLADAVVVTAVVELRHRVGGSRAPSKPAGATIYMALIEARSGEVLWSDTFDRDDEPVGRLKALYRKLTGRQVQAWRSADEIAGYAVDELVDELVEERLE